MAVLLTWSPWALQNPVPAEPRCFSLPGSVGQERSPEQELHGWDIPVPVLLGPSAAALQRQKVNAYFPGGKEKISVPWLPLFESLTAVLCVLVSGKCVCCYGKGRRFSPSYKFWDSPEQREALGVEKQLHAGSWVWVCAGVSPAGLSPGLCEH